jgi:hypothetical protein
MDPAVHVTYGWKNPFWLVYYPREMSHSSPLVDFRTKLENWRGAVSRTWHYQRPFPNRDGTHGLGRIGADFWKVAKDSRGRPSKSLAGYYPESYWGQLNMNYCLPHLFNRGRHGAIPTVRSEAFRENIQEVEARTFIEKALLVWEERAELQETAANLAARIAELDKQIADEKNDRRKEQYRQQLGQARGELKRARDELSEINAGKLIGADLYRRARAALDKRIRMCLHSPGEGRVWFISSDWNRRNEELFNLAAEVAAKLAK